MSDFSRLALNQWHRSHGLLLAGAEKGVQRRPAGLRHNQAAAGTEGFTRLAVLTSEKNRV
jgi:hypothetical protein